MQPRIDYPTVAPDVRTIMRGLEQYVHQAGLDPKLLELVKLRASLINGCAYCIDMAPSALLERPRCRRIRLSRLTKQEARQSSSRIYDGFARDALRGLLRMRKNTRSIPHGSTDCGQTIGRPKHW